MKPIPTKPVWYLIGRTSDEEIKVFEIFRAADEARVALTQKSQDNSGLSYSVEESESIIPDRILPTEKQRIAIGDFLHWAFVALRNISYGRENFEAIEELTDILHNLPVEMFAPNRWDWNSYIYGLRKFEEGFPDVQTMNLAAMLEDIRDNVE